MGLDSFEAIGLEGGDGILEIVQSQGSLPLTDEGSECLQPGDLFFCLHGRARKCISKNVQCGAALVHLEPSHWHHIQWPSDDAELDHGGITVTVQ